MKMIPAEIDGVLVVESVVHRDERGFFVEIFNSGVLETVEGPGSFRQMNHSHSKAGVLRGLHYQNDPAQGKLITVVAGQVFDVAVDLRPESGSFGRHVAFELSAESGRSIWIPPGFAHGFCCTDRRGCDLVYMVTAPYNREGEGGIVWNDPELKIDWPVAEPVLSERDRNLPSFQEFRALHDSPRSFWRF